MTGEGGQDGVVEFVGGGRGAGMAEILIQVIDAAMINQPVLRVEDSRLRRHLDLTFRYKCVLGIAQGGKLVAIISLVLANLLRRCCFAGID